MTINRYMRFHYFWTNDKDIMYMSRNILDALVRESTKTCRFRDNVIGQEMTREAADWALRNDHVGPHSLIWRFLNPSRAFWLYGMYYKADK